MSGGTISTSDTRAEALKLQSSAFGVCKPVCYGVTRVQVNLLDYLNFQAVPHTTSQGGKGLGGPTVQNTTYSYTADVVIGLGHGPISGVARIWRGKSQYTGGLTPSQLVSDSGTFTVPGSGAMTQTLAHGSTYVGMVEIGYGSGEYATPIAENTQWVVNAGVLTIVDENLRGAVLAYTYQYTTGGIATTALDQLGLTLKTGAINQATWSGLAGSGAHELGYSGEATLCGQAYDLGTSAQVENHNVEVIAPLAYHLGSTQPDVDISLVVQDMLTNGIYGANFPAVWLGGWQAWSDWCVAAGLLVSPALTEQVRAADLLDMAARLTNTQPVWTGGKLLMVPYADTAVTGNGRTFTPNTTPVYALTLDNWKAPLVGTGKSPADRKNHVLVQYRDRTNAYAPAIAEATDKADVDVRGLQSAAVFDAPWICEVAVARRVAQILLERSLYVPMEYSGTLPPHYAFLDPGDIITNDDAALGMVAYPLRVTAIDEDEGGHLTVTCEDYPAGVAGASFYPVMAPSAFQPDYNAAPGNVATPAIFEGPADWAGNTGIEVYAAVRGSGSNWGGCQVWVSLDGTNYVMQGVVYGGARYGTLSTSPAAAATSMGVQGLGSTQLISGSAADAAKLTTLCYVGGAHPEFLAYQTATFTGTGAYTLSGLVHGGYGTADLGHSSGDMFVRVDERIVGSGPLDVAYVGQTIYFKFCSFNLWGGAQQDLASVSAYTYAVTGAMAAARPGQAGKGVQLVASGLTFQYPKAGGVNPASLSLALYRKGVLQGAATWSVIAGTATLTGTGDSRTLTAANLTTDSATIQVSVTDGVATYLDQITVVKVREGADGANGADGLDGANGAPGNDGKGARVAFTAVASGTTPTGGSSTVSGDNLPAANTWGMGETWSGSTPTLTAGQVLWVSNGLYDPVANQTVWKAPYSSSVVQSSFSVSLSGTYTKSVGGATSGVQVIGTPAASVTGGRSPYTYAWTIVEQDKDVPNVDSLYLTGTLTGSSVGLSGYLSTTNAQVVRSTVTCVVTDADGRTAQASHTASLTHT